MIFFKSREKNDTPHPVLAAVVPVNRPRVIVVPEIQAKPASQRCAAAVAMLDPGHDVDNLHAGFTGPFLLVRAHDCAGSGAGRTAPSIEQIGLILDFHRWAAKRSEDPVLFFCAQGISRSPALAFGALADQFGEGRETEAFEALTQGCKYPQVINPNTLILALFDTLLERNGALIEAGRLGLEKNSYLKPANPVHAYVSEKLFSKNFP